MTVENCKKCDYHKKYINGAVHCGFDNNLMSMASVLCPKTQEYILLTCPREKDKKR